MTLEQKLNLIDGLYCTDHSGVVSRLDAPARNHAEQLLRENASLSVPDLLPRLGVEEPLPIPAL